MRFDILRFESPKHKALDFTLDISAYAHLDPQVISLYFPRRLCSPGLSSKCWWGLPMPFCLTTLPLQHRDISDYLAVFCFFVMPFEQWCLARLKMSCVYKNEPVYKPRKEGTKHLRFANSCLAIPQNVQKNRKMWCV